MRVCVVVATHLNLKKASQSVVLYDPHMTVVTNEDCNFGSKLQQTSHTGFHDRLVRFSLCELAVFVKFLHGPIILRDSRAEWRFMNFVVVFKGPSRQNQKVAIGAHSVKVQ